MRFPLLILLTSLSFSEIFHVPSEYPTIQEGIDVAQDGDTVLVDQGIYYENLKITRSITLASNALYDELTVQETLRYFGDMRNVKRSRLKELLEFVGLELWARQPSSALSGGMKQRLMLAVALLSDPPTLLLDEPTANLDVRRQLEFRDLINLLVSEGKTVVLTTHLLGDVDQVAKKIMLINKGKLVIKSSVADLFKELDLSSQMYIELADPTKENDAIIALEKAGATDITAKGPWLEMGIDPSNKLDVLNNLRTSNCEIKDFKIEEPNLEDAFMKITGEGQ